MLLFGTLLAGGFIEVSDTIKAAMWISFWLEVYISIVCGLDDMAVDHRLLPDAGSKNMKIARE